MLGNTRTIRTCWMLLKSSNNRNLVIVVPGSTKWWRFITMSLLSRRQVGHCGSRCTHAVELTDPVLVAHPLFEPADDMHQITAGIQLHYEQVRAT